MSVTHHSIDMYPVHRVPLTRPFVWLAEGWDSLVHHWGASLGYGVIVAALGGLILAYDRHPLFIALALSAFMVVGPVITAGLCELSRCRDHGERGDFQASLRALASRRGQLLGFAEALVFVAVAAFTVAALFLYTVSGSVAPAIETTVWGDVMAQLSGLQLATYALTLGVVAGAVFALSVVSVPMIIDRHVDPGTAMQMSLRVCLRDLPAMAVWALLIISLVAFAFGTRLWGMIIVLPLLGHATWYAYRDIVEEA